jgi:RNA polymerase sigma-70 factor (ECF subfamily)
MEDQTAISRLKQGDLFALEILVGRYQVQAVHAAYMIVWDRLLAEDLAQMAFVKVAERIHQYDETRPFGPWFFRIVVNDAIKAAARQKRTVSLDEPAQKLAEKLIEQDPGPEQLFEQKEARELLMRAIQQLPPHGRAVVVMRYYLDMSEDDMSAEMQRPLSTIKWWLRDARKRLRSLLDAKPGLEDGR